MSVNKHGPVPCFNWSDNQTSFQELTAFVKKPYFNHIHADFEQEVVKRERPEHQAYKRAHIKERSWIHPLPLISPFPSALFISRMNTKRHSWVPSHKLCKHFLFCCTLTHRLINNKELSARKTDMEWIENVPASTVLLNSLPQRCPLKGGQIHPLVTREY